MLWFTVVSSVFGKQFSNIHASLGSFILAFTLAMVCSTASDVNLRSPAAGRFETKLLFCIFLLTDEAAHEGFTAIAVNPTAVFFNKISACCHTNKFKMFVQPQTVWPLLREGAIMLFTGYISCQFPVFSFNEGCIWRTVKIPAPYIRLQDYLSVTVPSCLLILMEASCSAMRIVSQS